MTTNSFFEKPVPATIHPTFRVQKTPLEEATTALEQELKATFALFTPLEQSMIRELLRMPQDEGFYIDFRTVSDDDDDEPNLAETDIAPMPAINVVAKIHEKKLRHPYLATPYTKQATSARGGFHSANATIMAEYAAAWTGWFAERGLSVDSPIVTAHAACMNGGYKAVDGTIRTLEHSLDPLDGSFWSSWCRPRMERSDCLIVPPIYGRDDSRGVLAEIYWFLDSGKPVFIIEAD